MQGDEQKWVGEWLVFTIRYASGTPKISMFRNTTKLWNKIWHIYSKVHRNNNKRHYLKTEYGSKRLKNNMKNEVKKKFTLLLLSNLWYGSES